MGLKKWPINSVLVSLLLCAGCGGDAGPTFYAAKGTLTKGDKPLGGVLVTFTPADGGPSSSGLTNDSGVFVLLTASGKAGVVAGKHKVTLSVSESVVSANSGPTDWSKMAAEREKRTAGGDSGAPVVEKKDDKVPPEYTNPSTSPLPTYEVKTAGSNEFEIKIP